MKGNKEELPLAIETPAVTMRVLANQGGMAVARYHFTAESDFSPLLAALPGGGCSVPHWGYVISGQMALEYANGTREVYEAGQVYYQPPGHIGGRAAAGTEIVEFSPEPDYTKLIDTFQGMMRGKVRTEYVPKWRALRSTRTTRRLTSKCSRRTACRVAARG